MVLSARRTVLSCVVALGLLLATAPSPSHAVTQLRAAGSAVDPTGPLVAAVALLAWALALWLAVTTALVLAARAPGLAGRVAATAGRRVAPVAVRRTLELALGVTVTVSGLAAPAAASTVPSLDWPALTQSAPAPPQVVPAVPAPVADTVTEPVAAPVATPPPSPGGARPSAVVVAAGDTLWGLAEAHLERTGTASPTDRQVAAAWPQWWAANREAVGADPHLIRPGTVLHPPTT